ncbi:MAG: phosphotransferase [Halanaerobiales bacterium]|nr:phosphotransferase [Halanaerobiales bacterium]
MIEKIIEQNYNLKVKEVRRLGEAFFEKNHIIMDDQGCKYFLKKCPSTFRVEHIRFEISLMRHLNEKNSKVPRLYCNIFGEYFFEHKNNKYMVYKYQEGNHEVEDHSDTFQQLGKELALIHQSLQSLTVTDIGLENCYYLSIFEEEIISKTLHEFYLLIEKQQVKSNFESLFVNSFKELLNILETFREKGYQPNIYIHGDLHCKNIMFKDKQVNGFIDFSNANYSIIYEDIINITYDLSQRYYNQLFNKKIYDQIIQGYIENGSEVFDLDLSNLHLIFQMSKLRDLVTIISKWKIIKRIFNNQNYCYQLLSNILS